MPMGDIGGDVRYGQYLPLSQVRKDLEKYFTLTDLVERTSDLRDTYQLKKHKID